MSRKHKILVPEAREGLDRLKAEVMNVKDRENVKYEVADEKGISLQKGYNGNIKAKDAGEIGGSIGGNMVRELVKMAQKQMTKQR
ncbi:alpha/beta-type small acid-soluble spore protein [Evansella cellulosilytica]|uniref:Small acid-soluble spore protein alpha/beta type n=1 Tax=Evansella cellulosilytica (strain ATCC 21833 / DSM 2522 / FERM P-1141 / JCM 9156 / N-4) TaxID=649639 RepID=E6TQS8_EVAC2|nr:alpha/beta-type small acid-soluble spore protein [Evansella cellulosilytica]ADU31703.1 small acid-soluble spore protein alpha/beta type [Evansella cellulosilytica DSM 2522]